MAIFEYPKTRRDEWYNYLASPMRPYFTVGYPPVGIEVAYTPPTRAEDKECWAKRILDPVGDIMQQCRICQQCRKAFAFFPSSGVADPLVCYLCIGGVAKMVDDVKPIPDGETPEVWDRMENVVSDIQNGRLKSQGKARLRGALDKSDAPLTGRAKADAGLGRAIRFGGV